MKIFQQLARNPIYILVVMLTAMAFYQTACVPNDDDDDPDKCKNAVCNGANEEVKEINGACKCVCKSGFKRYQSNCVAYTGTTNGLSADISGQDVAGSFKYEPVDVDVEITQDSIIIDGYIDHSNPDSSSYIYLRLTKEDLGDMTQGSNYRFDRVNHTSTIASHKYPFAASNEIYFADTGSVTLTYVNYTDKFIEIDFDFSVTAGHVGQYRYIKGTAFAKPE